MTETLHHPSLSREWSPAGWRYVLCFDSRAPTRPLTLEEAYSHLRAMATFPPTGEP